MNYKNWLDRVLKVAAERAGLVKIDYPMCRRGIASLMRKRAEEEDHEIATHLRHKSVETSRSHYIRDEDDEADEKRVAKLDELYEAYQTARQQAQKA